jgi:N-acetylglucosaminyl-diphospho-decaprenol L-rhamnosyltransferase
VSERIVAVVVHFANATATERCVRSLLAAGLRTIVVDNAGTYDASRPATEVIRPGSNLGYGRGANLGLRRAFELAPLALLVNDDVTLEHPEGIEGLADALEAHRSAGIAGPLVLDPHGEPQPTVEEWPSLPRALRLAVRPYSRPVPAAETEVEAVSGVCMLVAKRVFDSTGGFDPAYFLYAEELDLCRRAAAAGFATIFVPVETIVHHHEPGEVRGSAAVQIRINYVRFCRDHRGFPSALGVALLFLSAAVLRRRRPTALARGLAAVVLPERGALVDRLLVPALVAAWVVLLALGSSWVGSLRSVGRVGKFAVPVALIAIELPRILAGPRRYAAGLRPGLLDVAVVAFIAFGALSAIWSMLPHHTLVYVVGLAVFAASVLLAPRRIVRDATAVRGLLVGILVGTAVVLVANVFVYAASPNGAVIRPPSETTRFRGLLESPDELGSYALVAPLVLWWAFDRRRGRFPAGAFALGLLLAVECALSGSRAGLALLVAAAFIFFAGYRRGARIALAAVAVTVACVALSAVYLESPSFRSQALPGFLRPSTLSTFGGRTEAWAAAAHLVAQRPLGGFGLGNELHSIHLFRDDGYRLFNECLAMPSGWLAEPLPAACQTLVSRARRLAHFSGDNAHNSFLGLGVQVGSVVGALTSLALLAAVARLGTAVRARDPLQAALLAAGVVGLGLALVETYLFDPGNVVAAAFWLLLVVGLVRVAPKDAER